MIAERRTKAHKEGRFRRAVLAGTAAAGLGIAGGVAAVELMPEISVKVEGTEVFNSNRFIGKLAGIEQRLVTQVPTGPTADQRPDSQATTVLSRAKPEPKPKPPEKPSQTPFPLKPLPYQG